MVNSLSDVVIGSSNGYRVIHCYITSDSDVGIAHFCVLSDDRLGGRLGEDRFSGRLSEDRFSGRLSEDRFSSRLGEDRFSGRLSEDRLEKKRLTSAAASMVDVLGTSLFASSGRSVHPREGALKSRWGAKVNRVGTAEGLSVATGGGLGEWVGKSSKTLGGRPRLKLEDGLANDGRAFGFGFVGDIRKIWNTKGSNVLARVSASAQEASRELDHGTGCKINFGHTAGVGSLDHGQHLVVKAKLVTTGGSQHDRDVGLVVENIGASLEGSDLADTVAGSSSVLVGCA
ncbi:hypothetical protein HG531_013296 [Fusarium graminearum]|nr:hypothetical protein HG531_013296 [Fusarium graminearum]